MKRQTANWHSGLRAGVDLCALFMLGFGLWSSTGAAEAAELVNRATATALHDGAIVRTEGRAIGVRIEPPSPTLHLSLDVALGGDVAPGFPAGDRLDYEIVVENAGDVALSGVRLELKLRQGDAVFAPSEPPGYKGGDLKNPGILDRGEVWRYQASHTLDLSNVERGGPIEAEAVGKGSVFGRILTDARSLEIELPPLQGIARGDVSLAYTPSTAQADVGDQVDYTITVSNRSDKPLQARLTATLAEGTALVPGSVFLDGELVDVSGEGSSIDFGSLTVPPHNSISARYLGDIQAAPTPGYQVNSARIVDEESRIPLAPASVATVKVGDEALGDCAEMSVLVYEDANRNGIADPEEAGVSGVRIEIDDGEVLTTDLQGQFFSPCLNLPRLSAVELRFRLDESTLEDGYHATTPNPMALRIESGGGSSVTFGVAQSRIIRVDLNAAAFRRNETEPDSELSEGLTRLVSVLAREHSVLRLTYFAHREPVDLPEERLETVRDAVLEHWAAAGGVYDLQVETRVVRNGG